MKTVTIPPKEYGHQTPADIQFAVDSIEWTKPYSPEIIYDLANVIAARQLGIEPEYRSIQGAEDEEYFEKLIPFLDAIDPSLISGNSPIQKAVYFNAAMENMGLNKTDGEEQPEPPKPVKKRRGKTKSGIQQLIDALNVEQDLAGDQSDLADQLAGLEPKVEAPEFEKKSQASDDFKIDILLGGSTSNTEGVVDPERIVKVMQQQVSERRDFAATIGAEYCKLQDMTPELMVIPPKTKDLIDHLSVLKTRKQIHHVKNPETTTPIQMQRYSQIPKIHAKSTMLSPMFDYKFATKQLLIKKKQQKGKQEVVFLIDGSGSMADGRKVSWVKALLMDRFEEVSKGGCKLYALQYESKAYLKDAICVDSKTDVKKHLKWFPAFSLGATNIEKSINQTIEAITKDKTIGSHAIGGQKPEIVVILDGDDFVRKDFTPKYIVHAFLLGKHNKHVEDMCKRCGGTYELLLKI